jgi:hypothetical protein
MDDQVTGTRLGAVGDRDRGTLLDDAQLDEVVPDATGQLCRSTPPKSPAP